MTRETGKHPATVADPERLFLEQLETIERAISYACRRGSLRDENAEDFASYVKLKLIEKDYAAIRKYERRASFGAFISVVVQRLLLDYRIGQWGKWHASAEAKRLGEPAITIEAMLYRERRTLDESFSLLIRRWPDLTRESIDRIVRQLPSRAQRLRPVTLEIVGGALATPTDGEEGCMFESEQFELARQVSDIVRNTMQELEDHDRLIFRLRFEGGMSVAEISRMLRVEQKPLYRRLQRVLMHLRRRLEEADVTAADAEKLLMRRSDLDFGFENRLALDERPASGEEGA